MFDNVISFEKLEQKLGEIGPPSTSVSSPILTSPSSAVPTSSQQQQQQQQQPPPHLHGHLHHLQQHHHHHTMKQSPVVGGVPNLLPPIHAATSGMSPYTPTGNTGSYPPPPPPPSYSSHMNPQQHSQAMLAHHSAHMSQQQQVPPPAYNNNNNSNSNNKPSSSTSPHVEYLNDSAAGWIVQWFNDERRLRWKLGIPQFKYCKKRKDHFSDEFSDIWYKAPYKYHMSLDVRNMTDSQNVMACIDLNYEDGQKVVLYNNAPGGQNSLPSGKRGGKDKNSVITNNENSFTIGGGNNAGNNSSGSSPSHGSSSGTEDPASPANPTSAISTVTIGPFSFNICSYKQDGRKFRMVIYLYEPSNGNTSLTDTTNGSANLCCCLISPAFTIRAKKPIAKPGSKKKESSTSNGKKRKSDDDDEPDSPEPKKMKNEIPMELSQSLGSNSSSSLMMNGMSGNASSSSSGMSSLDLNGVVPGQQIHQQPPSEMSSDVLEALLETLGDDDYTKLSEKQAEKNPEKIGCMVGTFQKMNDQDRKILLCRLIESCLPHEKEFVFQKYFGNNSLDTFTYGDQQQQQPQSTGSSGYASASSSSSSANSGPNYFYGNYVSAQQLQAIQQQQQDIYDYFAMLNARGPSGQPATHMQTQPTQQQQHMPQIVTQHTHQHMQQQQMQQPHLAQVQSQQQSLQPPSQQQQPQQPQQVNRPYPGYGVPNEVDSFFTQLFD